MERSVSAILDINDYEYLREVAQGEKISIKEAVKQAILKWIYENKPFSKNDPFFKIKAEDLGDSKLSMKVDEILYGGKLA